MAADSILNAKNTDPMLNIGQRLPAFTSDIMTISDKKFLIWIWVSAYSVMPHFICEDIAYL
jgi:hypothetical protein